MLPEEFAAAAATDREPEPAAAGHRRSGRARFRADYYRTLSELYEDNFLGPAGRLGHGHGVPLRVQSYGEPPATLASYARSTRIEGEQWGWTRCRPTKWATSAAHHLGVPVVSSETWTWVHAPSFRATPLDLKGEAHEHFLLGHQPADRARLAVLAPTDDDRSRARLVLLRLREPWTTATPGGRRRRT